MRVAGLLAASVVASLLAVPQTNAGEAGPEAGAELRGVTRISGDETGYTVVELSRRAEVDIRVLRRSVDGPNPGVRVDGGGAFAGFALTTAPSSDDEVELLVVGGRFSGCGSASCSGLPTNYMEPSSNFGRGPDRKVLKPGRYRLYLLTDGVGARVALRLDGLDGRTELRPQVSASADMKPLEPKLSVERGQSIASAGNDYELGPRGFVLMSLVLVAKDFRGVELGGCLYSLATAPPSDLAYGPHCSGLMEAGLVGGYHLSAPPPRPGYQSNLTASITALFDYAEGHIPNVDDRHGAGLWYASTGVIDHASAQFVYVTF